MAWFPIALTDAEQAVVHAERDSHPEAHVRRKMLALWLLHCGLTRAKAAEVTGLGMGIPLGVNDRLLGVREDDREPGHP